MPTPGLSRREETGFQCQKILSLRTETDGHTTLPCVCGKTISRARWRDAEDWGGLWPLHSTASFVPSLLLKQPSRILVDLLLRCQALSPAFPSWKFGIYLKLLIKSPTYPFFSSPGLALHWQNETPSPSPYQIYWPADIWYLNLHSESPLLLHGWRTPVLMSKSSIIPMTPLKLAFLRTLLLPFLPPPNLHLHPHLQMCMFQNEPPF